MYSNDCFVGWSRVRCISPTMAIVLIILILLMTYPVLLQKVGLPTTLTIWATMTVSGVAVRLCRLALRRRGHYVRKHRGATFHGGGDA